MIIKWIKNFFTNKNQTDEMKAFNIVHIACIVGLLCICMLVNIFIEDKRSIYLSFCIAILFFLTLFETNRTGKKNGPIIAMSIIFNFIYLPAMFFMYGKYICVIPIYFIFGIIYSILLLELKIGIILASVETAFFFVILIYGYFHMPLERIVDDSYELKIRYFAAIVAIIVGGVCAGAATRFRYLYYQREQKRVEKLRVEAMDAYVAKDMFLINMSHEIRTPMNAIVGTVNLLLDRQINERVSESVYNILNSCNALLSITNELMDLSKVESGGVEVYCTDYDLAEMLLEIINMMTVRLAESNLSFYVDINPDIPTSLYGDASKIRQLFVNLLNNATKFTREGKIFLRVDYRPVNEDMIELIVDVEDTGCGIKKERLAKIFDRTQKEAEISESKETSSSLYTGMGLSICSDIIEEMDGEISVQSKYGVGSVFTFKLPQKYNADERIATRDDINIKNCRSLVFEIDEEHAEHTKKLLGQLGAKCDIARNKSDFERLMSVNDYTHVFIANDRYDECDTFLNNRLITSKIIAILEIDDNVHVSRASTVINSPVNIINLMLLLTNENNNYVRNLVQKGGFVCPYTNILVVDDNDTNLNVASSILRKYGANVYTASSGKECLRIIKDLDVDIIFLDYMMPEMNGIDTLNSIRKLPGSRYTSVPVIVLTANVVSGAKEMFLEAGFDEFLAKPIVIEKMEKVLKKYLPKDQIVYK